MCNKETSKSKRFTLTLPPALHEKLGDIAEEQGTTIKDVVIKSMKLGMIAFDNSSTDKKEFFMKETKEDGTQELVRIVFL